MSFLTTTKLIGKHIKPTDYKQYISELVLLALIAIAVFAYKDLAPLRDAVPIATIEPNDVALMAGLGLYAIRLSSFIAMLRAYRLPQTAEWLVFLIITIFMLLCFAFSGSLVKTYATEHNYRLCYRQGTRGDAYVFAHAAVSCPNLAQG